MASAADPAAGQVRLLHEGWAVASCAPDAHDAPDGLDDLDWVPATVPGTVAGALTAAGRWSADLGPALDGRDWWYRTRFSAAGGAAGRPAVLHLDGLATVAEVFLNGTLVAGSDSMFVPAAVDVSGSLAAENDLAIRFRALDPLLRVRRKPRARWRTKVARDGNLRWFRTTLLGRAPGFSSGPAPVGPWRAVRLERPAGVRLGDHRLRATLSGDDGRLTLDAELASGSAPVTAAELVLEGPSGVHRVDLDVAGGRVTGVLTVPAVARWWPHTHGAPVLHDVRLRLTAAPAGGDAAVGAPAGDGRRGQQGDDADGVLDVVLPRVGFRDLAPGASGAHDVLEDGLDLHVNGVRVFARGSVWTSVDPVGLNPDREELRRALEQVVDAGMNLVRIAGTGVYESAAFHELCDELGVLVWQDLAFANLDYPAVDGVFAASVAAEVAELGRRIGGRPSTAVVCGNSEVEQQVEMLGLDPGLGRDPLFGTMVPGWLTDAGVDVPYVPSAPCGGVPAFRPDTGIAVYHGVGGYRRPVADARRAGVRFAAECLAFANVPDDEALADLLANAAGELRVHHPAWKAGVPRDVGSGWDFDDVRDHYLRTVYDLDPLELRAVDHERYLELSRQVTGEVMAETFGEWRRAASTCGGGLVLWHRDVVPGAGWGVVDHRGGAKVALHHLRRALAPVAVWLTDEGLNGLTAHVANDRDVPLSARLRVGLFADGETPVADGALVLEVPPHTTVAHGVDAVVGRFVDSGWSFRFGPPPHDVVVATLEEPDHRDVERGDVDPPGRLAVHFPAGRPLDPRPAAALGLTAVVEDRPEGPAVVLESRGVLHGVRIAVPGWLPADDALVVAPGRPHVVALRPDPSSPPGDPTVLPTSGTVRAINVRGLVPLRPRTP